MSATMEISRDRLMAHVTEFAKRIKLSGTEPELESFFYLKSTLDALGYRTNLIRHDAYISLPGAARVVVGNSELKSITHSFSRVSPAGGLRGALVDVGEGGAAEFANKDVRGRIVLAEGIASPAVAARASAAGAIGQLHMSPHEHLHEMCISPVWGSPSEETLDALPSTVACTVSQADGQNLRDRLAAGEAIEIVLHAEVDTGWRKTPILVAELDPPDAPKDGPFVLFSGHHDTWYYGVMDNGSANATMLECARVLATERETLRRGLRICFWSGHSHGRYSGSSWYADRYWQDLDERCVAHVNVDSTGGIGATVLTDTASSAELVAVARAAIHGETGQDYKGKRNSRSSDASFWGIGVPSMFGSLSHQPPGPVKMRNALGWWWHTPDDLIDKIDPDFLARDTRVFLATLRPLLTDAIVPLDCAAQADALLHEARALAAIEDAVPVSRIAEACEALRRNLEALDPAHPHRANAALLKVSHALVPLDLTEGDRFRHDPALPQPAWPVLQPLRALAKAPAGSEAARFLTVDAMRACNRVLHAVRQANAAFTN